MAMLNFFHHYLWPIIAGLAIAALLLVTDPFQWVTGKGNHSVNALINPTTTFADAVSKAAPSVVNIYAQKTVEVQRNNVTNDPYLMRFLRRNALTEKRIANSLGSGVIVSDDGYILTAMHIIQGAELIVVLLPDGREVNATIIGNDFESDLSLLKVELDNLPTIPMGEPNQSRIGDVVLAIGNPFGIGQSVSQGIISGLKRSVSRINNNDEYIQTDAGFNFGSSGGALIDVNGNILGINSRAISSGIGFTTPIDVAMTVVDSIINNTGWVGFQANFIPENILARYEHLSDYKAGLLVDGIYDTGPADAGGLELDDVILMIDEVTVSDVNQVHNVISQAKPGQKITFKVYRQGEFIDIELIAAEKPS